MPEHFLATSCHWHSTLASQTCEGLHQLWAPPLHFIRLPFFFQWLVIHFFDSLPFSQPSLSGHLWLHTPHCAAPVLLAGRHAMPEVPALSTNPLPQKIRIWGEKAINDRMEKLCKPTFNFKFTSHEEKKLHKNFTKIRYSSKNYQGKWRCYFIFPVS